MSEAYTTDYSWWQPRAETRNWTEDEGTIRVWLADAPLGGLGMSGNQSAPVALDRNSGEDGQH